MADDTARERQRAYNREWQRKWRAANPELARQVSREASRKSRAKDRNAERIKRRRYEKMRRHGPDAQAMFMKFWQAQDGCCYLCGDPLPPDDPHAVAIDHDHRCCPKERTCGVCRRGLACGRCNRLIGLADDDPERIRRIAAALEYAIKLVTERLARRETQEPLF